MPHNDNYLCNILRQRLRDYRPTEEGSGKGAWPLPEKNMRYKLNYLHHVRTQCAIGAFKRPCARPVKFPPQWKPHVKEQHPVKVFWAPFITMGGHIVIMNFTRRHWLLLVPSKLQSSLFIFGYLGTRQTTRSGTRMTDYPDTGGRSLSVQDNFGT